MLCFEKQSDVDALHDLLLEAIKTWHTKLGIEEGTNGRSGVQFRIKNPAICGPGPAGYRDRRVYIEVEDEGKRGERW